MFPGWKEGQGQHTSLPRKDAWTQTTPARRRIRHAQVQGAGESICHWLGPGEQACPCYGQGLWCGGWVKGRAGLHKMPGFKQSTGLYVTHLHLTTSLISGLLPSLVPAPCW